MLCPSGAADLTWLTLLTCRRCVATPAIATSLQWLACSRALLVAAAVLPPLCLPAALAAAALLPRLPPATVRVEAVCDTCASASALQELPRLIGELLLALRLAPDMPAPPAKPAAAAAVPAFEAALAVAGLPVRVPAAGLLPCAATPAAAVAVAVPAPLGALIGDKLLALGRTLLLLLPQPPLLPLPPPPPPAEDSRLRAPSRLLRAQPLPLLLLLAKLLTQPLGAAILLRPMTVGLTLPVPPAATAAAAAAVPALLLLLGVVLLAAAPFTLRCGEAVVLIAAAFVGEPALSLLPRCCCCGSSSTAAAAAAVLVLGSVSVTGSLCCSTAAPVTALGSCCSAWVLPSASLLPPLLLLGLISSCLPGPKRLASSTSVIAAADRSAEQAGMGDGLRLRRPLLLLLLRAATEAPAKLAAGSLLLAGSVAVLLRAAVMRPPLLLLQTTPARFAAALVLDPAP